MPYSSKYGVARHIYIAIPKAGSAAHAVSADWSPAAGDCKISKDGAAAANVTNLPVAIAMGNSAQWDFSLTATEMQAAQIVVTVADSATKAVDDTAFGIDTYGHASAQHEFDLDTATPTVDIAKINNDATLLPKLAAHLGGVLIGVLASGSTPSVIELSTVDGGAPSAEDNAYRGRWIQLTSGTYIKQFRYVHASIAGQLHVLPFSGSPVAATTCVLS